MFTCKFYILIYFYTTHKILKKYVSIIFLHKEETFIFHFLKVKPMSSHLNATPTPKQHFPSLNKDYILPIILVFTYFNYKIRSVDLFIT